MKTNDKQRVIYYFGFGTNKDTDMMEHIIGRKGLKGEPGKLYGYEICIQRTDQSRTRIPPSSPLNVSAKELIESGWGPNFEMFVSRPNPESVAYGTIWQVTSKDLEYIREWELVDYGAQEDAWGIAVNDRGEEFEVITQSFMRPPIDIDRVVKGKDYDPYIWDKEAMLKKADEVRQRYIDNIPHDKV